MADEVEAVDTTITDEPVVEQEVVMPEGEVANDDDQEIVISIGEEELPAEEEVPADAPQWVKDLRKSDRENKKLLRDRERRIAELEAITSGRVDVEEELGPEPTLDSCGYDEEEFKAKTRAWDKRKDEIDARKAEARTAQEEADATWQGKLASYQTGKAALKVPDYDDAEAVALELFSDTQRGIIIHGAKNSPLLTYAIGKDRKRAVELAAIKDNIQFTWAVAQMETQLKVTNRSRSVPAPERTISSTGSLAGSVDGTLDRLRAEAERTNDYSKVLAYKRQHAKG